MGSLFVFQFLHLTDDQGWRIEIRKHPKLTAGQSFYTQEELADLIRYAAERHVEIVPELDIPGHTVAVLAAYPELGCTHTDTIAKNVGETVNLMLCANNEKVYEVYKDIIDEVSALFPSRYIHLGGDEAVIEKNWTKCERCQKMMKELKYEKASQLMIPFFSRMLSLYWIMIIFFLLFRMVHVLKRLFSLSYSDWDINVL